MPDYNKAGMCSAPHYASWKVYFIRNSVESPIYGTLNGKILTS